MLKPLYVFVEGVDDSEFVKKIFGKTIRTKYLNVTPITYSQSKNEDINKLIKTFKNRNVSWMIMFDADIGKDKKCITEKKKVIRERFSELKDEDDKNIIMVEKEIESWYLAGVKENDCKKLGIPVVERTDTVLARPVAATKIKRQV